MVINFKIFEKIVFRGGNPGDYYTPNIDHAENFGDVHKYYMSPDAKIFDINKRKDFEKLLNKVGSITFHPDKSIFKSYEDFINHTNRDIIAEANNSWIVEQYSKDIKEMGYDVAKFMDGGYVSYLVLSKNSIQKI
jgi:hypothetical protein